MAKIQNADKTECLGKTWGNRNSHSLLLGVQTGTTALEDSLAVLFTKLNIILSYDSVILLLGIYPNNLKI